ncbi:MAG: tRNA (N(6)-L-threonylcarbamoyladenosine(37)-C(2))-methylthiotransferase MtaB [Bacillota bacterium]
MEDPGMIHHAKASGNVDTATGPGFPAKAPCPGGNRVSLLTLGCKVNQVETEALSEEFVHHGYQIVDISGVADIYVINTCAVTRTAEKKSRAIIRRAKRRNPQGLVVVTGCYAQLAKSDLMTLPEVDLVISNQDKEYLVDCLIRYLQSKEEPTGSGDRCLRPVRYTYRHGRTRGFIKIQDGCENYCSYCIVPLARGPVRSKLPEHVLTEVQSMVANDYREIVLNGIHLGQYGKDLEGWDLTRLLELILTEIPGDYRIRLGSVEPTEITEDLVELVVNESRLCNHLHIPLQSGSDKILKAMNRHYTAAQYLAILADLYHRQPQIGLTADVMVGFPGEGEREFGETCQLVENSPLNDLHVFRFSARPGTRAAVMENQVSEEIKNERSQKLIELGHHRRSRFLQSLIGEQLEVLTEETAPGGLRGLSGNYVDVVVEGAEATNCFYLTSIYGVQGSSLLGKIVEP